MNNTVTKITLTEDQLLALAAAVDISLDSFYEDINAGLHNDNCETTAQLEGLQAILGERILSLTTK